MVSSASQALRGRVSDFFLGQGIYTKEEETKCLVTMFVALVVCDENVVSEEQVKDVCDYIASVIAKIADETMFESYAACQLHNTFRSSEYSEHVADFALLLDQVEDNLPLLEYDEDFIIRLYDEIVAGDIPAWKIADQYGWNVSSERLCCLQAARELSLIV